MTKGVGTLGRAVAVTLTAGVVFGLAGCGDQQPAGPGYAIKDNIVEPGNSAAALGRDEIISVSYKAAMEAGSAHLAMTMNGRAAMRAEGDMTYEAGASEMRMTMSMPQLGQGSIEMRYVGQKIYVQLPGMTPPGKFVAIDPLDQSSPLGKSFSGLTDQMDPLASVKSMESAVTSANRVGEGKVDGARVDHYRVAVDTAKMMKDLDQTSPARVPDLLTYDMWLDEDNLIRKMSFDVAGTSVEMAMSRWGQPVKVLPPADGDIVKSHRAPRA